LQEVPELNQAQNSKHPAESDCGLDSTKSHPQKLSTQLKKSQHDLTTRGHCNFGDMSSCLDMSLFFWNYKIKNVEMKWHDVFKLWGRKNQGSKAG
jgi:hypothetical protein